jgi:two-component system, chemotaxis family, protein-glutamate methylesterase/glutaminase
MIRVLIVDDSATTREAISAILESEPSIQIIGQAMDGKQAVEMTEQLKPDVITMDINMPEMNGHEATVAIMAKTPTPIVVLTSISQADLVHQGLDILLAGALEIVQKPTTLNNQGLEAVRAELIEKVLAVAQVKFQLNDAP